MALSLELMVAVKVNDLRDLIETLSLLREKITAHFDADDGINPEYIRLELIDRRLRPDETVFEYRDALERLVRRVAYAKLTVTWRRRSRPNPSLQDVPLAKSSRLGLSSSSEVKSDESLRT